MTMLGDPARDQRPRTRVVILVSQVAPELHGVVVSCCQLLTQIGKKRIKLAGRFGTGSSFGKPLTKNKKRAFPPDHLVGKNPLSWGGAFNEIPPVMVVRMRLSGIADTR